MGSNSLSERVRHWQLHIISSQENAAAPDPLGKWCCGSSSARSELVEGLRFRFWATSRVRISVSAQGDEFSKKAEWLTPGAGAEGRTGSQTLCGALSSSQPRDKLRHRWEPVQNLSWGLGVSSSPSRVWNSSSGQVRSSGWAVRDGFLQQQQHLRLSSPPNSPLGSEISGSVHFLIHPLDLKCRRKKWAVGKGSRAFPLSMEIILQMSLLTAGVAQNKHRSICKWAGITINSSCCITRKHVAIKGFFSTFRNKGR